MNTYTRKISLESTDKTEFIDVTKRVGSIIKKSGISNGSLTVYAPHTTTAIRINENEPRLIEDLKHFFERKAPSYNNYLHDDMDERDVPEDEKINAHSHLKAITLGASETIPLVDNKMMLGKWQSIFFVDFDGPQKRNMFVHIVGK